MSTDGQRPEISDTKETRGRKNKPSKKEEVNTDVPLTTDTSNEDNKGSSYAENINLLQANKEKRDAQKQEKKEKRAAQKQMKKEKRAAKKQAKKDKLGADKETSEVEQKATDSSDGPLTEATSTETNESKSLDSDAKKGSSDSQAVETSEIKSDNQLGQEDKSKQGAKDETEDERRHRSKSRLRSMAKGLGNIMGVRTPSKDGRPVSKERQPTDDNSSEILQSLCQDPAAMSYELPENQTFIEKYASVYDETTGGEKGSSKPAAKLDKSKSCKDSKSKPDKAKDVTKKEIDISATKSAGLMTPQSKDDIGSCADLEQPQEQNRSDASMSVLVSDSRKELKPTTSDGDEQTGAELGGESQFR